MPYTLRHDKDQDLTRTRSERCGHRIDPLFDDRTPDVGADTAERRTVPPRWNLCNAQGRLKDMAARTLLLKLEQTGHIQLPPRQGRTVACVLFGSAAWKCADRDAFIGWDRTAREHNLQHITNNTRALIPSWVRVPHLASHVPGLIARRIRSDWQAKYGHPVYALETFVDRSRFKGTCYRAANWVRLGATQGRTRNDRAHSIKAPIKDVSR